MGVPGTEGQLVALGPLEVQVGGILPGHPDTAVQLDALLGGLHRDVAAVRRGTRAAIAASASPRAAVSAA